MAGKLAYVEQTMSKETKSPEQEELQEQTKGEQAAQETEGAEAGQSPDELRLMLEDARSKADEHWEQLLRTRAELENARRRAERDVESAHKYALEKFASELLPVKDSLELGLNAVSEESAAGDERVAKLREGVELTLKMLGGVFEKFGISEVNPVGQPFDPQLHQAMSMQETTGQPPNSVVLVVQKGYLLNDRLLRPAMVMVAKAPEGGGGGVDEQA